MDFTVRILVPANDFINTLPMKMQSKVYRTIDLLREFGYKLPVKHVPVYQDLRNCG